MSTTETGELNPKHAMGASKTPILRVVPASSILAEAEAIAYGSFRAPKKDGTLGYGPYNWRDTTIEATTYIDAAIRHLMAWYDGEEYADDSGISHLGHAKAGIGILIDALTRGTVHDDRPPPGVSPALMNAYKERRLAEVDNSEHHAEFGMYCTGPGCICEDSRPIDPAGRCRPELPASGHPRTEGPGTDGRRTRPLPDDGDSML